MTCLKMFLKIRTFSPENKFIFIIKKLVYLPEPLFSLKKVSLFYMYRKRDQKNI